MSLSTVPKGSVLALTARVARDSMARRPSSPSAAESESETVSAARGVAGRGEEDSIFQRKPMHAGTGYLSPSSSTSS